MFLGRVFSKVFDTACCCFGSLKPQKSSIFWESRLVTSEAQTCSPLPSAPRPQVTEAKQLVGEFIEAAEELRDELHHLSR